MNVRTISRFCTAGMADIAFVALDEWERRDGAPTPLGATWIEEEQAYNFAVYSKHAEAVTLLLFSESDFAAPIVNIPFEFPRNKTRRMWHARCPLSRQPMFIIMVTGLRVPLDRTRGSGSTTRRSCSIHTREVCSFLQEPAGPSPVGRCECRAGSAGRASGKASRPTRGPASGTPSWP